jgi:polyferredoxin
MAKLLQEAEEFKILEEKFHLEFNDSEEQEFYLMSLMFIFLFFVVLLFLRWFKNWKDRVGFNTGKPSGK